MKTITLFTAIFLASLMSLGQHPSMTISHSGLAPYDTLTIIAGDSIDFIFGGGSTHPMTEGWPATQSSTPVAFTTQTVTSTSTLTTFAINTPGTYYFHCGTNPSNTSNWGKITVLAATGIKENKAIKYNIYPNPTTDILVIEGLKGVAEIFNLNGKKVMEANSSTVDIKELAKGTYIVKIGEYSSTFIKK